MSKLDGFLAQLEEKIIKQGTCDYNGNENSATHEQKLLRKALRGPLQPPASHESLPGWG